mmetsp:Transcript_1530/g.3276  ORF Transcript_1530/g.3276 Transcript_1530/m.3276 type:complete len:226 (-) Transcript_1530:137-814(-)
MPAALHPQAQCASADGVSSTQHSKAWKSAQSKDGSYLRRGGGGASHVPGHPATTSLAVDPFCRCIGVHIRAGRNRHRHQRHQGSGHEAGHRFHHFGVGRFQGNHRWWDLPVLVVHGRLMPRTRSQRRVGLVRLRKWVYWLQRDDLEALEGRGGRGSCWRGRRRRAWLGDPSAWQRNWSSRRVGCPLRALARAVVRGMRAHDRSLRRAAQKAPPALQLRPLSEHRC